ncbi:TIGR02647 family protein [Methylomarinum sp. Ch1-1]|uniref:TIGR02647 family protein n=1 Tax=Methylomarinum roseum TaxID=3067653 RepID=A0AAU7NTU3_9GAMM|nr:TIGR02647 family protein [Methylomarinum sp. Ch1-1]MDP4519569.1 TIGR02647 family protein [Methylomarinum sp. Ch1-1]
MVLTEELVEEINLLSLFNLETLQEGIKVHADAGPHVVAAARRLHDKGIISQADGGYLTDLGIEVAEHAQRMLTILTSR